MSECLQSTPGRPTSPISNDSRPYYDGTECCLEGSQGCRGHTRSKNRFPQVCMPRLVVTICQNDSLAEPAAIPDGGLLFRLQTASKRISAHRIPSFWHTHSIQRHYTANAVSMTHGARTTRLRSVSLFSACVHTVRWGRSATTRFVGSLYSTQGVPLSLHLKRWAPQYVEASKEALKCGEAY
jgi:hypothetical protein